MLVVKNLPSSEISLQQLKEKKGILVYVDSNKQISVYYNKACVGTGFLVLNESFNTIYSSNFHTFTTPESGRTALDREIDDCKAIENQKIFFFENVQDFAKACIAYGWK